MSCIIQWQWELKKKTSSFHRFRYLFHILIAQEYELRIRGNLENVTGYLVERDKAHSPSLGSHTQDVLAHIYLEPSSQNCTDTHVQLYILISVSVFYSCTAMLEGL